MAVAGSEEQIQSSRRKRGEYGPQIITKRGVEVAIVLSYAEYRKLLAPRQKLSDFFRDSPLVGADLDLARDTSYARNDV